MQTSKPSRKSSSEISQRTSPAPPRSNGSLEVTQRASPVTPKSTRATKTSGVESESTTPKYLPSRTPVDRSPKNIERRSPRSPVSERKRPSRMTELESQLTQVQEDLKKAKDQLGTSESWRRRAQQEAEEAKKQLIAMNTKLEDSQRQVIEFSAAEEARLQELRKISEERDCAWQSELEATQKQQYIDSNALTNAMNEIEELKQQLAMVVKSDDAPGNGSDAEHTLKQRMAEALLTIEQLEEELKISRRIEAETQAVIHDTQQKFEMAKKNAETLSLQGLNLRESVNSKTSELQESRARVALLEGTVKRLQTSLRTDTNLDTVDRSFLESEVEQLKYELEVAEIKYQEEQIQSMVLIRSAYEFVESVKVNFAMREAELESALKNAKAEIFECKAGLIDKETQLQCISEMNKELTEQIEQSELKANLIELKVNLLNKETELQSIIEENEVLKADMAKSGSQDHKSYETAIIDTKLAREAERDALMKLGRVSEEADKSSRRAAKVAEQLVAAQVVNSEMEAELRRLRVQSDQWRKAAEAAAAALSPGDNGRFVERTSSLDIQYQSVAGKLMSSPFSDDLDDDWPKKKNNIVMRKISGLWKKSPK